MATPTRETTTQGFELQVGTNHFGHFRLAEKLWSRVAQKECRTVVLSSTAHTFGGVELDDLHYTKGRAYSPWGAYGQSKACNLLFAKELSERLAPSGASAFSVHPGVIRTNLWREDQGPSFLNRLGFLSFNKLLPKLLSDKTIEQGAATTVYACLAPRLDKSFAGAYFADCNVATPAAAMSDPDLRKQLWEITEAQIAEVLK
uniref:Protochlorophyllide reductase n=2 Tax=Octactis speculum TaxID=3111310 RepID=A0A7S2MJY0_9STRA|mmetsp:Transcript_63879/g.87785  ORF Transcript_63879/g.87785 Transcript_63879/m.87785 type:complete len:202 (+) Transcript_63879:384-989(+)